MVSVLTPVYNAHFFLKESIESTLAQTFTDFELILLDDGSTDSSADVIRKINDPRIRLYQNPQNMGLSYSRNRLIELALGEFIAWLDADDIALPDRLEKQINCLQANPKLDMIGGGVQPINQIGKKLGKPWRYKEDPEQLASILFFKNSFAQSAIMLRKSALPSVHYRPEFPLAEDYELWTRIIGEANCWNLPDIIVQYRIHEENVTHRQSDNMRQAIKMVQKFQLAKLVASEDVDRYWSGIWEPNNALRLIKTVADLVVLNEQTKVYPSNIFSKVAARFTMQQSKRIFGSASMVQVAVTQPNIFFKAFFKW